MADPITPLTAAEQAFVAVVDATWTREAVLARLKADLQTAITIELATVPIYLFTYYSLIRNNEVGETIAPAQLYANKAGGIIMSVAVEEMLHLSLSSNILFAMGVSPRLYGQAPASYPTGLPYHNPRGPAGPDGDTAVRIPLAKLGYEQLWHFLQIEYPEQWDALPQDRAWDTIGQFYSFIRCLLSSRFLTDADFQRGAVASAIQPGNYSPNNIDTVYPTGGFDPWKPAPPAPAPDWADPVQGAAAAAVYPDADDSHAGATPLLAIGSIAAALAAIDTICDQGEGTPVAQVGPSPDDDPSDAEQSHYAKFLTLQAQFADYAGTAEVRPAQPPAPAGVIEPAVTQDQLIAAGVLVDFADSPVAADYPVLYRDIANFSSALFQYMLVMIETIYLVPPDGQKLFFNEGLHRSMIWVMDKYFRTIRQLPITEGPYKGTMLAPTFENVSLGTQAASFAGLTAYGQKAIAAANALIALIDVEQVVFDIAPWLRGAPPLIERSEGDLVGVLQNVIYYVGVALTKTGADGGSMHLPDVGPYWLTAAATAKTTLPAAPAPTPPADDPVPTPYPYAAEPVFPTTIGTQPAGMPLHACMGLNSCRGSDRYGTAGNPVSGVNDCAGQGYCSTGADHTCHVQNECAGQGGCGLYGTAEELDRPGANACRSLGSCASPINAERFSTNGPNRGKSVWLRARAVFEENWAKNRDALRDRQAEGLLAPGQLIPDAPGRPPAAFAGTGPSYLWISEDNVQRGNMTACGSSGMSGAGGCS